VIVDLRPDSPTFTEWFGIELREGGDPSLFVPAGFAHGFQTLEDASEVSHQMSYHYVPEARAACAGTILRSASSGPSRRPPAA
jgi:dTDP-4-dehydrorhamnose 3,5-epimerase